MLSQVGKDFNGDDLCSKSDMHGASVIYKKTFYKNFYQTPQKLIIIPDNGKDIKVDYKRVRMFKLASYQQEYLHRIIELTTHHRLRK